MKFSEYKYERLDVSNIETQIRESINALNNAETLEEVINIIDKTNVLKNKYDTSATLCSIRFSINTRDEFYEKEQEYLDETSPLVSDYFNDFNKALISNKFISDLENVYGKKLFDSIRLELSTFSKEIIRQLQEENRLCTKYSKLLSSAKIPFDGKVLNLSQFGPYTSHKDRSIRKEAEKAFWSFFENNEEELDNIYDSLIKVRDDIAKKLGFKNFIKLGYARLGRQDYDENMVANYRKQIFNDLVPITSKIYEKQKQRLGLEEMKSYDFPVDYLTGNAKPKGNAKDLLEKAKTMYHEMSKETGEFIDFMIDHELLDLEAKEGKTGGGYSTFIADYKSPFIFSNFNGTSGDVDVLTHEAGHAFQFYSSKDIKVPEYICPTLEACEIHSMSMEFFAWPWMKSFFEEDESKYLYSHLTGSITFIPYGAAIDEFQHEVYLKPELSPSERKSLWRNIERKYLPDKVYENKYLEKGTYWLRQSHVFEVPFYYIDYTLAQVCAQQFWIKNRENHEKAWKEYYDLCCAGGSKTFLELLKLANLKNSFEDGTIKYVVGFLNQYLEQFDQNKLK